MTLVPTPAEFREIASGRRKGAAASLWRGLLSLGEPAYRAGVAWRNRRYDRGRAEIHRAGVPVVCVGNLTVGGTGKTPMIAWLARHLRSRGVRVAIVSRGYGTAKGASTNDEALELEMQLPDVPHVQNADRVAAARVAAEELESELILLDDGFQHRRLHRDYDLLLIDAVEPFGYGRLLPRGLLREPLSSLSRAQAIALTRADLVSAERRRQIEAAARRHNGSALWLEVVHRGSGVVNADGARSGLEEIAGERAVAFCGIGNPAAFRRTIESLGADLIELREFPDHHAYDQSDIEALGAWASRTAASVVLCTRKDLVKIGASALGGKPLWAVAVEIEFLAEETNWSSISPL